jgi:hypothetical protein
MEQKAIMTVTIAVLMLVVGLVGGLEMDAYAKQL